MYSVCFTLYAVYVYKIEVCDVNVCVVYVHTSSCRKHNVIDGVQNRLCITVNISLFENLFWKLSISDIGISDVKYGICTALVCACVCDECICVVGVVVGWVLFNRSIYRYMLVFIQSCS